MSIFNKAELKKQAIINESGSAYRTNLISQIEFESISAEFKSKLYIPKLAIRIGLFVSVVILLIVVFALFVLMFLGSFDGLGFISIFLFFVSLIFTLYLSRKKMHFGSGADNAFLYCSIIFFMIWVYSTFTSSSGGSAALILFILCSASAIIFLDKFLTVVALIALLSFVYFKFQHYVSLDFLMISLMILSLIISWLSYSFIGKAPYWEKKLLITLLYSSLITAAIATNYFFVSEITNDSFLFKIIFNVLMILIPLIYLLIGIRMKSLIFLRCGGLLLLVGIYSLIYMYSFNLFTETLCIVSAMIISIAWWLSHYLSINKGGFVFIDKSNFSNLEGIGAIHTVKPPAEGFSFGGGSFGGGGASGDF